MDGYLLQRCFVNLVYSLLEEEMAKPSPKFKSQTNFAKVTFSKEATPVKIWQDIRIGRKGQQQPRGVSIEEAYMLAFAFDEKVDRLLVKTEMLIKDGWSLDQDIANIEEAKRPGRPTKKEGKKNSKSIPQSTCITDSTNSEATNIEQPEYGQ